MAVSDVVNMDYWRGGGGWVGGVYMAVSDVVNRDYWWSPPDLVFRKDVVIRSLQFNWRSALWELGRCEWE